jgi:uncharacterized membrane protein
MRSIAFDFPQMLLIGPIIVAAVLSWQIWRQRKKGVAATRVAMLALLRAGVLLLLVFLAARPVHIIDQAANKNHQAVALLIDSSLSMSLEEDGQTRYQRALDFARKSIFPVLDGAKLQVRPYLFSDDSEPADGPKMAAAKPEGKRTNLGGAMARALENPGTLAVIALTDGAANIKTDNTRALSALLDSQAPFIGIGFGSDTGVRALCLRQVEAPPVAAPNTQFQVTAHLEAINVDELPAFDLLLMRDGELVQKKTVQAGSGSRFWMESFHVKEAKEGAHSYEVQLLPPSLPGLTIISATGSSSVRITSERELRVLYVQGALTWDYKFIGLALRGDPAIKVTGLTRTSSKSLFRQNVENVGELLDGFPTTIEGIAPFRVIVLSNMRPTDLSNEQQELLARFCGELGGGLLMLGGPETFDASWHSSRLEQLLPVVFSDANGVQGLDRQFQLELTGEALQSPVFQISDSLSQREAWNKLPKFHQYGRVDSAKPGAQVWALHQTDEGPKGRRILMASQRYGNGLSAILTVQNFWVWRLSKDSEPQQFDRFWRQLFRYLGESSRQDVSIQIADQELRPGVDINLVLEKVPSPKDVGAVSSTKFTARVQDGQAGTLAESSVELPTGRPVNFSFHPTKPGLHTVSILDNNKQTVATRVIEIREMNVEFQNSARNMENLSQWASLSGGMALRAEDCRDNADLGARIVRKVEQARNAQKTPTPIGINGLTLAFALGCLGLEWVLRKRLDLA